MHSCVLLLQNMRAGNRRSGGLDGGGGPEGRREGGLILRNVTILSPISLSLSLDGAIAAAGFSLCSFDFLPSLCHDRWW